METIIQVKDVAKRFGDTYALRDLSFETRAGEVFGFLGPSGAGKTTTIKLLTRQLRHDGGEIAIFSRPVEKNNREDDDRIGVLSDNSGVYERLSVWDNLSLYATLRKVDKAEVSKILEAVGLLEHKNKRAKVLSRGMKQRLMLAQAILHRPPLLFLDEPTASLDPATTRDIHTLLRQMNRGGTTIFLTTHNMEEADRLCHRVAFLNEGQIAELDTPEALKLKYADNKVVVQLEDGRIVEEEKTGAGLERITAALNGAAIARIHSQEPNLEEVFLRVTGRKLV